MITVKTCAECPFFVQTVGSFLFAFISKPGEDRLTGECDCPTTSGLRHHAPGQAGTPEVAANRDRQARRMRVLDGQTLPEKCPLRSGDVLVTLGS